MEADLAGEVQTVENNCLDMDLEVVASLEAPQVLLDTDDVALVVQVVLPVEVQVTLMEAPWRRASVEVPY